MAEAPQGRIGSAYRLIVYANLTLMPAATSVCLQLGVSATITILWAGLIAVTMTSGALLLRGRARRAA